MANTRRQYLPYAAMAHADDALRWWLAEVLLPDGGVYVAESGQQAFVMLAVSTKGKVDWIDHLYVRPGWTGQGIGALSLLGLEALISQTSVRIINRPPVSPSD